MESEKKILTVKEISTCFYCVHYVPFHVCIEIEGETFSCRNTESPYYDKKREHPSGGVILDIVQERIGCIEGFEHNGRKMPREWYPELDSDSVLIKKVPFEELFE